MYFVVTLWVRLSKNQGYAVIGRRPCYGTHGITSRVASQAIPVGSARIGSLGGTAEKDIINRCGRLKGRRRRPYAADPADMLCAHTLPDIGFGISKQTR